WSRGCAQRPGDWCPTVFISKALRRICFMPHFCHCARSDAISRQVCAWCEVALSPRSLATTRRLSADPISLYRGIGEQGGALRCREFLRVALERVVKHRVRERDLVDWEIALEHAAVGPELFDAVIHQRGDLSGQLLGADRLVAQMPVKAEARHAHAAE